MKPITLSESSMMALESRSAYEAVVAPGKITQLLVDWSRGEQSALHTLTPLIYRELHQLAQSHIRRERAGQILQPTALLHEAYLRMVWRNN